MAPNPSSGVLWQKIFTIGEVRPVAACEKFLTQGSPPAPTLTSHSEGQPAPSPEARIVGVAA